MNLKFLPAVAIADPTLNSRQIKITANSGQRDRVGDRLFAQGCKFDAYNVNNVVLADHDRAAVVGNFAPEIKGDALVGVLTFAPQGISPKADQYCALYKAGVMKSVSVGFRPIEFSPNKDGGIDYRQWELLELSCVAVPCDPGAVVVARALGKSGRVLNAQNSSAVTALIRCLDKSAEYHVAGIDSLDQADRHRSRALNHAAQILANAGDSGGASDDPENDPGDDPDDDVELAYEAERRNRMIEIAARAVKPAQEIGGAFLTAQVREEEIARLDAMWNVHK